MKKLFPIFSSISVLIITFSFAYYFVIFLPSKEKVKQEIERSKIEQIIQIQKNKEQEAQGRQEEANQKTEDERTTRLDQLEKCLDAARLENSRIAGELVKWAEEENKDGKYDLTDAFNDLKEQLKQTLEECYRKYPQ